MKGKIIRFLRRWTRNWEVPRWIKRHQQTWYGTTPMTCKSSQHWCYTDKFKILIFRDYFLLKSTEVCIRQILRQLSKDIDLKQYLLSSTWFLTSHSLFGSLCPDIHFYAFKFRFCSPKMSGEARSQNKHLKLPEHLYALLTKLIIMQFPIILHIQ